MMMIAEWTRGLDWPALHIKQKMRRLAMAAAVALAIVLVIAGLIVPAEAGTADREAWPDVTFMSAAVGVLPAGGQLRAQPAGGQVLAQLPPGTRVSIGGTLVAMAGLRPVRALWVGVRPPGDALERYGFVVADAVSIVAGRPPALELDGLPLAALLSPSTGLRTSPAVGGNAAPVEPARVLTAAQAAPIVAHETAPADAGVPDAIDIAWLPRTVRRWAPQLVAAGQRHGVDPALLALVMLVESGGNPQAVSSAGAVGLMQVMPTTGADIARRRGIEGYRPDWLYEPQTNIDFGTWYLADLLATFGRADDPDWQQSVALAAVGYNGGPGSARRWLAGGRVPAEAVRYRTYIAGMWGERTAPDSPTLERWLAAGGHRLLSTAEAVLE